MRWFLLLLCFAFCTGFTAGKAKEAASDPGATKGEAKSEDDDDEGAEGEGKGPIAGKAGEGKAGAGKSNGASEGKKGESETATPTPTPTATPEPAKDGQPTPWDGSGKHKPENPGLFPQDPHEGPGGRGKGGPSGKLEPADENNPAFQFVAFGNDGTAGMCQMTRIDTPLSKNAAGVKKKGPCPAMSAAHCFQQRVDKGKAEGEWLARISSPQLGSRPVDAKVYTMEGYTPHMQSGGMRSFHVSDAVVVMLPEEACESLDKEKVPELPLCSKADKDAAYFLMSHRLGKQTVVYDNREGDRVVPEGYYRSFAKRPSSPGDRVIMQGDSGGPIVKMHNPYEPSSKSNWVCMSGAASTAPIVTPEWGAPSANYAAGDKVVKWLNDKTESLMGGKDKKVDRQLTSLDSPNDPPVMELIGAGGRHRLRY